MGLKKSTSTLPSIAEAGQCWLGVINWAPPLINNTFCFPAESPVKQPFFNHNCAAHQIKNEISPITTTKQNI